MDDDVPELATEDWRLRSRSWLEGNPGSEVVEWTEEKLLLRDIAGEEGAVRDWLRLS